MTDDSTSSDDRNESRYKTGVALTLAALAILGVWIAILQTNASTNESQAAREATRLAAQAQTATVLEAGALAAVDQIEAELTVLPLRSTFRIDEAAAEELGFTLDPDRAEQRTRDAEAALNEILASGEDSEVIDQLQLDARLLALQQSSVVDQRVTWNARASQYETVMTTLAVAIFLVGFTVVVTRKVRPPLAVPGLVLAVFCLGWSLHIYMKPIPDPDQRAIDATASGQVALENDRAGDAVDEFSTAIAIDDRYRPAYDGRALAGLVAANPDALRTLAFTDTSAEALDPVTQDLLRTRDLGGDQNAATLTIAGFVAIAAEEFELADSLLRQAVALNELTPGLQFTLSAVSVAMGDEATADEWRDRAIETMGPIEQTDRNRELFASYLTLLEFVADRVPEQAALAEASVAAGIAGLSELTAGRPLEAGRGSNASLVVDELVFKDDTTAVSMRPRRTPRDTTVATAIYERPAENAAWVQPAELFYVGPPGRRDAGTTFSTPRACTPVEYRVDFYVEGELVDRVFEPGGPPTC